jgi:hypothetical protein
VTDKINCRFAVKSSEEASTPTGNKLKRTVRNNPLPAGWLKKKRVRRMSWKEWW